MRPKLARVMLWKKDPHCEICREGVWVNSRGHGKRNGRSIGELDHRIPLVEGGIHDWSNLRLLCTPCHKGETAALARRRRRMYISSEIEEAS